MPGTEAGGKPKSRGTTPLYGIDSMLFVYHFEDNEELGPAATEIFRGAESGRHRLVTSVLSLMEELVLPKRRGMTALAERYREIFESFPNLTTVPIDAEVVEIASELRARHNLRTPDALHVATAIHSGADAFLSHDKAIRRKVTEIPVRALREDPGGGRTLAAKSPSLTHFIGIVDDDGRVDDAFGDEIRGLHLATPAPAGTWGLFESHDGRAKLQGAALAAADSALAGLYALAARRRLSPLHPPAVETEAAAVVADPGIDAPDLDDLTHLPFVTIDEVHSRDLDQALYIERRAPDSGFTVWYAIADPAWSVRPGTALFAEALARGATYYMPGLVIPMLPRQLSEGVISLNPGVDRRALVFEVALDADGRVVETTLHRARVRSCLKTSYDAVQAFLEGAAPLAGGDPGFEEASLAVAASLELLREVGSLRIALAESRDVISIRRREIAVSLGGEDGDQGTRFVAMADPRNDVERYNEQISLLCNVEGARFLARGGGDDDAVQPIYRVHEPPLPEDLDRFAGGLDALMRLHNLDAERWGWRQGSRSLASYLKQLPASGPQARLARAVHRQARLTGGRSLFDTAPGYHFGVGADVYGRFTAPMREIVGVFLHKETWEKLGGERPAHRADDEALREQVVEASNRARQIQRELDREANRRVLDQLFGDDLQRGPDERPARPGTVLGISRSKAHVGLDEPPIDVKVYLYHLSGQRGYRVSQGRDGMSLRGPDGERLQAVGNAVRVRVLGHDAERDRWELELVEG